MEDYSVSPMQMKITDMVFLTAVVFAAAFFGSTIGYVIGRWLA